ncbi:hypothetical protein SKAU_G00198920 [Synaphobranchus kaupii]|uniref:Uncharacterized protein n=1 Tax=Synaphobranchus kaupii TaxID=118154 RepID=A0A9Q1IY02_SYNKA|nr:hypothetical protein SKAU_G00198920 [Synaphobranchus kaupii]
MQTGSGEHLAGRATSMVPSGGALNYRRGRGEYLSVAEMKHTSWRSGQPGWWQRMEPRPVLVLKNGHGPRVVLLSSLKQTQLRTELSEAFHPVGPLSQQQAFRGTSGLSEYP